MYKKSGTFLLAAPILVSTSATVQYGRWHACIQIITTLKRKTANISLGFSKFQIIGSFGFSATLAMQGSIVNHPLALQPPAQVSLFSIKVLCCIS